MKYRLQFRRYRLPFRTPVRTAHGPWHEREGLIVRLESDSGEIGFGECAPLPDFGTETIDAADSACRALGDKTYSNTLAALPKNLPCLRHAFASALLWERKPSGFRPETLTRSAPGNALPVACLLPTGRAALNLIEEKSAAGFRTFKWKIGVAAVADELVLLDDVCAALPSGAKLRLDANGALDRRAAERWLERAAERPIEFIEQPGAPQNRDLLLGLAHDFPTPLALDESIASNADIEHWLALGWPGVFVIKPSLLADVPAALEQLRRANADVVFSSALETALGARDALTHAFAWSVPNPESQIPSTRARAPRALGFGVYPLFADPRFNGPPATPFLRWEDVARLKPDSIWSALG